MGLHLRSGNPVDQRDFVLNQVDLMKNWSPVRASCDKPEQNDAAAAWVGLFARHVRNLCAKHEVPVDAMQESIGLFQQQIAVDLEVLKWAESCAAHQDIGWANAAETVTSSIQNVHDRLGAVIGYRLTLTFPFIPTPTEPSGPSAVREVFFPLIAETGNSNDMPTTAT